MYREKVIKAMNCIFQTIFSMETSDKNCTNEVKAHPEYRQLALPKEDHFMDFVIACILLEIIVYISLLICYRLHLFIGSLGFLVSSIFLTLSVETIRMIIAHTINIDIPFRPHT